MYNKALRSGYCNLVVFYSDWFYYHFFWVRRLTHYHRRISFSLFLLELIYDLLPLIFILNILIIKPYHLTMDLLALDTMKNAAKCDT